MEVFGQQVEYPTLEEICRVNFQLIEMSGGEFVPPDNLINSSSLEYILSAIRSTVFGIDPYPSLKEKAAAVGFQIISRHVFFDGSKRTGVMVAWALLEETKTPVFLEPSIEELTVSIADGKSGYSDLLQWLHEHQSAETTRQ